MLMCGLAIGASFVVFRGRSTPVVVPTPPITNKTAPIDVQRHFAEGKEYSQFPATAVQMRDGTCYAYTNGVSWLVFECFGSVKP